MASCSLGASNIKIFSSNFGRARVGKIQTQSVRAWTGKRPLQHVRLAIAQHAEKALTVYCGPPSETECESPEETKPSTLISQLIPNAYEVESLLTNICDTTSIAEFELKLGGFHLYVTRDLMGTTTTLPTSNAAPVSNDTTVQTPVSNGSVSTPSLAIFKPGPSSRSVQTLLDRAADEGLVIIPSPRVGYFRRSRTIKGKRAPPSCKENQSVKEGQVLCYIEQLGGELPIESDISGEVIKILREDGDPVGYGDALIAILPSFPGIKKLQ